MRLCLIVKMSHSRSPVTNFKYTKQGIDFFSHFKMVMLLRLSRKLLFNIVELIEGAYQIHVMLRGLAK